MGDRMIGRTQASGRDRTPAAARISASAKYLTAGQTRSNVAEISPSKRILGDTVDPDRDINRDIKFDQWFDH